VDLDRARRQVQGLGHFLALSSFCDQLENFPLASFDLGWPDLFDGWPVPFEPAAPFG